MTQKTAKSFVPPLDKTSAPQDARSILEKIESKFGKSMNIFNTMAYQPEVLKGIATLNDGLQNDLPAKYRELAYYKASQLNDCDYCLHYHKQAAEQEGVTCQQLSDIAEFESSDSFDEKEKSILRYAEELTKTSNVQSKTVESVKEFLNETQLVTLASAVALANFTNRFNHGLGIQLP